MVHQVQRRAQVLDGLAVDDLASHTEMRIGFGAQAEAAQGGVGLGKRKLPARGKHDVEPEFLAQ